MQLRNLISTLIVVFLAGACLSVTMALLAVWQCDKLMFDVAETARLRRMAFEHAAVQSDGCDADARAVLSRWQIESLHRVWKACATTANRGPSASRPDAPSIAR